MNLTPPPGTPVVKRSRAKSTTPAAPESKKPTLTTKTARSRKKTVAEPVMTAPVVETTVVSYSSDQLRSMIAMAAYYRAESRNFAPGNDMEDWLVAEQQVIANLT